MKLRYYIAYTLTISLLFTLVTTVSCKDKTNDITMLAKLVWGEARGVESDMEKAAVVWTVLNRVDSEAFPDTIEDVVTQPNQFYYDVSFPVTDELYTLCKDVLTRWYNEKDGEEDCGRVLPKDYYFYHGDGKHNYFRQEYKGEIFWDWSLSNPYED